LVTSVAAVLAVATLSSPAPAHADAFADEVVQRHNDYRRQYSAPELRWDPALAADAKTWGDHLAKSGCEMADMGDISKYPDLTFNYKTRPGQNNFQMWSSQPIGGEVFGLATKEWMAEAQRYDYNNPRYQLETSHFTQVV
jgi:hypothetical protein